MLPLSLQRGLKNTNWPFFSSRNVLLSQKVCCKVSLCENFQWQSCKACTGLSRHAQMGDVPFYLKFWTKVTHHLQKWQFAIYIRWFRISQKPSERRSIVTNRKSTTGLPMGLRWTWYAASVPPKRGQKRIVAIFERKLHLSLRKSATNFLCAKTVSGKVVRHSLACLSVRTWFGGDDPFHLAVTRSLCNS